MRYCYLVCSIVLLSLTPYSNGDADNDALKAKETEALKTCCKKFMKADLVDTDGAGLERGKDGICTYFHIDEQEKETYIELIRFGRNQQKHQEAEDAWGLCCDTTTLTDMKFFKCVYKKTGRVAGVGKQSFKKAN